MILVVEVLDRLVVQEAVHHPAAGLALEAVHVPPELRPPRGHADGEGSVGPYGPQHYRGVGRPEPVRHQARHHPHLQGCGDHVKHQSPHDEAYGAVSAIQHPAELAGAPLQVEGQIKAVQVPEHVRPNVPDGILGHVSEDRVPELLHARRGRSGDSVPQEEGQG